jgi:hypothetical protein
MARFEVKTPVQFFTGEVAGITFAKGRAVVTSDTDAGLRALYYFKQQGYGIVGLDEVEVDEVLNRANESAASEVVRLKRENDELKDRLDLDKLREENRKLQEQVFKRDEKDSEAQAGEEPTTQPPLLAPPSETASQAQWRKWAVDAGRVTEEEAKSLDKATIISVHGAAYDEERAARLRADAASEDVRNG